MKKRVLVIGIGQLGFSLAQHLHQEGVEVIALDNDEKNIENVKNFSTIAATGDASDLDVLKELGASSVDMAIICMGTSFESSIISLTNLLELKVPHISVRAASNQKAQIFKSIGAHQVFFVEAEMGKIMAHSISRPTILHAMDLGYDLKLVEWQIPPWAHLKTIGELQLPQKYKVQVIAIRDPNHPKDPIFPNSEMILKSNYLALLIGSDRDLKRLQEK